MSSKIEEVIDELEDYVNGCKYQALSNSKILVNKEELEDLIDELRMRVPEEVKKYQKIIAQQDAILKDAKAQAQNMINDAKAQIDVLVSDHEVMQRAYERAGEVVDNARAEAEGIVGTAVNDANNIRIGAMQYTDSLLENIQSIIAGSAADSKQMMMSMYDALQDVYDECQANRNNLTIPASYSSDNEADMGGAATNPNAMGSAGAPSGAVNPQANNQ